MTWRTSRSTSPASRASRRRTRRRRARPAPDPTGRPTGRLGGMSRVIVVGAGVVGLTSAVRLLEAGHRVDVVARDLPLETTSAVAAALWYPCPASREDRVTAWAKASYDVFTELAGDPATGVTMLTGTALLPEPQPEPWWRGAVPSLDRETAL